MILSIATVLANAAVPCKPTLNDWMSDLEQAGMQEMARANPAEDVLKILFVNLQNGQYAEFYAYESDGNKVCLIELGTNMHILLGETR